jgi:hypothetical protein
MNWQPGGWQPGWQPPGWQPGEEIAPPGTVVLTLSVGTLTEEIINRGGEEIILTLNGDTWVTFGATFDAQRQTLIDALTSQQSEATGWNAEVRDKEVVTAVVRTSDTVVTITLSPASNYEILNSETISPVFVPGSVLTSGVPAETAGFTVELTQPVLPIVAPSFRSIDAKSISDVYNQGQPLEPDYEWSSGRRFYQ